MKKEEIRFAWVNLVGHDNFDKLKLDENGYSNWQCRQLMPKYFWECLDSKIRPYKTKEPSGCDLLYKPKSLRDI